MRTGRARRTRRTIETSSYLAMVSRVLTKAGARVADEDPQQLRELLELRQVLDDCIVEAVRGLREHGTTWEDIGTAAGTTRQAALMRWGPKLSDGRE